MIIVTHGLTLRLLVMRWFQYSISDFEESINPPNGGVVRKCACVYSVWVCAGVDLPRHRPTLLHSPFDHNTTPPHRDRS